MIQPDGKVGKSHSMSVDFSNISAGQLDFYGLDELQEVLDTLASPAVHFILSDSRLPADF